MGLVLQTVKMKKITLYIVLAGMLSLFGCSAYHKSLKSKDFDEVYKAAMSYYEKKDYYKAGNLFNLISTKALGRPEMEDIKYYFAYCQYYQKEYLMSQFYFKEFVEMFPRSSRAEEAYYRSAYSGYFMSPRFSLDQGISKQTINDLQSFLLRYPFSSYKSQADAIIKELELKIEKKTYLNAKQYVRIREYKAAVIVCANFLFDYPVSQHREELSFLKVKSQYKLADMSFESVEKDGEIIELKKQRMTEVKVFYRDFIDSYPESKYRKESETYYVSASDYVNLKGKKKRKK